MKVEFRNSFLKDIKKLNNEWIKSQVVEAIERVEKAKTTHEIDGLIKLSGSDDFFRIRIGNYRIGLKLEGDVVVFVRILHRKDIYHYFP